MRLKKEKPLISVVVPVYNMEKYLERCMKSLLVQTYSNYEIILVNDGSTDSSGELCKRYKEEQQNVIVLEKQNGGLSDARNQGVKIAKGQYICFVDSDDYVSEDMLEKLQFALEKYNADISTVKMRQVSEKFILHQKKDKWKNKIYVLNAQQALEDMCYRNNISVSACAKLYKRELIISHPYPVGMLFEDLATTYKIIGGCNKVVIVDSVGYFYVSTKGSISRSKLTSKFVNDGIKAAREELKYIEKYYPEIIDSAKFSYVRFIFSAINVLSLKKDDKQWFYYLRNKLRSYDKGLLKNAKVRLSTKIKFCAVKMGYVPMIIVWKTFAFLRDKI